MVVPPDSNNPPTTSAASPHGSDLTLNGATSPTDVGDPDLRLAPEIDSSSPLVDDVPLAQREIVPPDAAAVERSHVDIFITEEADRSWLSRLRSLTTPWAKAHPRPPAPNEPIPSATLKSSDVAPVEPASHVDAPLASLAELRDGYVSIDQRLTRMEEVSGHEEGPPIDESLHALCTQMSNRLVRVEAAVQRTEGLAESRLPEMCDNIENQLVQARMALQRTEDALADKTLHQLCLNLDARLARSEDTFHRGEEVVARQLTELSGRLIARIEEVEGTLRLTPQLLHDSILPDIERQLVQSSIPLQRIEDAVTDKTLHELCQNIDARIARSEDTQQRSEGLFARQLDELTGRMTARFEDIEDTLRRTPKLLHDSIVPNIERQLIQSRMPLQRIEDAVADKTLHEICRSIDAGIERLEDRLHRSEALVAERLQELDARVTARLAESEETIQRIERIVSSRADLPFVAHTTSRSATPAAGGGLTRWSRLGNITLTMRPVRVPWMAGLVVPVLVLVTAMAIPALIRTDRATPPAKVVPPSTTDQVSPPAVRTTNQVIRTPSSAATVMANAPRTTRERRISPPAQRSPERASADRVSAPVTTRGAPFVGTLSITSVPSGASVSINGKPAGVTPLKLARQRAGSHAVQIAHEGFERWSSSVVVPADRLTQVTAKLRAIAR